MRPDKSLFVLLSMAAAAVALAPAAAAGIYMPPKPQPQPLYGTRPGKLSSYGLQELKADEGFEARAYKDGKTALGKQLYSIGYGHQITAGDGLTPQMIITPEYGERLLLQDVASRERAVSDAVKTTLTQNQFDALVRLAYNIGITAFKTSTLVQRLNVRDFPGVRVEFAKWNKFEGKPYAPLIARRAREYAQFNA